MHPAATRSLLLPARPTPLVGRAGELAAIRRRLADEGARLLTLVGPAGVGKTRLALAAVAADRVAERFPGGAIVVDLAPVREPALVLPAIARALGLTDIGQPPLPERLRDYLRERTVLLVLDNLEQVLPAGAAPLADLLAGCPGLALLATSRVPLRLRWEQTLRVPPLPVPDLTTALPPLDALGQVPAVALFVERAQARRADFALTAKRAPLVARLVAQLDGLPLALELAAARLDVLPLPALARRLDDRLRLLASAAPDRPERQRSLEAAVGWSYELLGEDERRLFRCLGVFLGRVALDAVAAVAGAAGAEAEAAGAKGARVREVADAADIADVADAERTLPRLVSLAEKSLILPLPARLEEEGEDDDDPEPAFGMLETVREYAGERLAAAGELAAAQRAHARYFVALAERADPQLYGRDQRAWYLRLERELDNLRAALRWLLDQDDPAEREAGLRLAGALGYFWLVRGYHAEGWRWLEEALARAPEADAPARTRALRHAGFLLTIQGDVARARAALEEALALAERRQDPAAVAWALSYLGLRAVFAGEVPEAIRLLHEARRRWEALGDPEGLGLALLYLGSAVDATGDAAGAAGHYRDALRWLGAAGDAESAGFAHCYLAVAEWKRGDLPRAVAQIQAGVRIGVALRDRFLLSFHAQAAAALVGARADPERRARLLGAADALAQATGATLARESMPGGQDVAGLRERLERGEGELAAAYRAGRALPFGEAAALALTLLDDLAQTLACPEDVLQTAADARGPTAQRASQSPLTEREVEVLRLVAAGRSNKAIGKQLSLSPSTVNFHLTSIYSKLGVNVRAQAVAEATRRGLL